MSKIEKYTNFAENVAWDNSHGYDQINRNGNPDYDCSGLVCDAVERIEENIVEGRNFIGLQSQRLCKREP